MECVEIRDPATLRANYWLLEEACERLTEREGREHFAPEVYRALVAGEARCFLILDSGAAVGFFAVQPTTDSTERPALHVWIGYARPGHPGVFAFGLRECELLAFEQGRASLVLSSCRRGWLRYGPQYGFELREFVFERRVSHEQ